MKWKDKLNRKYIVFATYVIIFAAIIFAFINMAENTPGIIAWAVQKLGWLMSVLKPVFFGFVFAYLTRPVLLFFEKNIMKIKFLKKYARGISVVLTLLLLIIIIISVISVLVFSVTEQIRLANFENITDAVNQMLTGLDEFYKSLMNKLSDIDIGSEQISEYVEKASYQIIHAISSAIGTLINSIMNVSGYFTTIMFSIIVGVYFMIDAEKVMGFLRRVRNALFKERMNEIIKEGISDLHRVFSGYIQGQLCDIAFMIAAISIALTITGVKFSAMIGVFTGLANLIPYLGPVVAYALTTLICVVNGDYDTLIISVILILIIQAVDGNIIEPKFLARSIKIHPLLVIIFLIFGSAIGGVWGMLLAVPIGGYIKVLFMKWLEGREKKRGIEPDTRINK